MTEQGILELIPEINLIESEELRRKSTACWKQVIELGGWEEKGIRNCPLGAGMVTEECPEKSIDHCRRVVRVCQAVWESMGQWANEISHLDHDTLICGAVLHDIGKFLEYDYRDGSAARISPSKTACRMRLSTWCWLIPRPSPPREGRPIRRRS